MYKMIGRFILDTLNLGVILQFIFILLLFFIIIVIGIGIIYYMGDHQTAMEQPLIPQEEEVATPEEEQEVEEEETESSETEENRFPDRVSLVIQEAFDRIFHRELKIVAIGDSLTYGFGDGTGGGGYVGILERSLNQERNLSTFVNLGMPGHRSEQLLHRLDDWEIQQILADADIILITIGANDIMQVARENITNLVIDDFLEERAEYEVRLRRILATIRDLNETADVYLLGIYNPFEQYFEEIEELNQIVDVWNDTGRKVTEEKENMIFIPIVDLFSGNDDPVFADDHFHPNYAGYYLIAERVLEYISKEED